jgi:hypothetical protein
MQFYDTNCTKRPLREVFIQTKIQQLHLSYTDYFRFFPQLYLSRYTYTNDW